MRFVILDENCVLHNAFQTKLQINSVVFSKRGFYNKYPYCYYSTCSSILKNFIIFIFCFQGIWKMFSFFCILPAESIPESNVEILLKTNYWSFSNIIFKTIISSRKQSLYAVWGIVTVYQNQKLHQTTCLQFFLKVGFL